MCFAFQRPTAKELLKHRFIRTAKKNSYLVELIERYKRWKQNHGDDDDSSSGDDSDGYVSTSALFLLYFFQLVILNLVCSDWQFEWVVFSIFDHSQVYMAVGVGDIFEW